MNQTALDIAQNLIERQPLSVRALFAKYKIKQEATVQNLLDAITVYGEPFLMELFNLDVKESHFLKNIFRNKDTSLTADEQAAKGQKWSKFKGLFGTILGGLNNVVNNTQADTSVKDTAAKEASLIMGLSPNKFYFFTALGVVVVLVVVVLAKNK